MLKRQWQIFVREMNKHGDHTKAYQKAYPSVKATTARVNGYTLLQNPTIAEKIKKRAEKIEEIATKEAAEELKDEIVYEVLTAGRKKELLRLISEGKLMHKVLEPVYNEETKKWESKVKEFREPSLLERLKAIELHNKMTGDFAPDKMEGEMKLVWEEHKTYETKH